MMTLPPPDEYYDPDYVAWLRDQSRGKYGRPAPEIDREFNRRWGRADDADIPTDPDSGDGGPDAGDSGDHTDEGDGGDTNWRDQL